MNTLSEMVPFIFKGGVLMIPLLACSIIALAIIIERAITLHRLNINFGDYIMNIHRLLEMGRDIDAISLCETMPEPFDQIFKKGVMNHGKSKAVVEEIIEETGIQEIHKLEKYLSTLGTIASISPLLGLLGTVTGMIRAFNVMAIEGPGKPLALAGGISEALITTATGLSIAIPTLVAYNYFSSRVDYLIRESEKGTALLAEVVAVTED